MSGRARPGAHIHLVVGPVGAGKSTFARELAQRERAARVNLDDWMVRLFAPDRPDSGVIEWYRERVARCIEQIWAVTQSLSVLGTPLVLEIGLILRNERSHFYERVDASGGGLTIYVVDAPRELRRKRVAERNAQRTDTFCMLVPPEIFELASDMWQPLDEEERAGRDVRDVQTA